MIYYGRVFTFSHTIGIRQKYMETRSPWFAHLEDGCFFIVWTNMNLSLFPRAGRGWLHHPGKGDAGGHCGKYMV